MKKKGWVQGQIRSAQREVEGWPKWMKKAARFEGTGRYEVESKERSSSTRVEKKKLNK